MDPVNKKKSEDGYRDSDKDTVEIYSHESCPSCDKAKKYLEDKGTDFDEKNIKEKIEEDDGPQAMEVPLICNGEDCVAGFNPDKIDKLLGE